MKFLRKIFDNLKEKHGDKKFYPLIDAVDTFAFTPNHTTKLGSHIRDGVDLKRTMMMVIMALVPCLLFGMWNVGHQHYIATGQVGMDAPLMDEFMGKFLYGAIRVLPLVIVSYASGLAIEFVFCIKNGHSIQEGFLVSGMLIPLIMPVDVPLWMVAVSTIFAVLIGKEVFGGTGMNILNVALTSRAFLFFAYPTKMSGNAVWIPTEGMATVDGYTGETALGKLATAVGKPVGDPSTSEMIQSNFAEGGIFDLHNSILGTIPGSIGETSVIAILLGAVFLLWVGVASWRVMVSMFAGGFAMAAIFNAFAVNEFMALDPLHQLMIGGFMFGMVFMATDPVTAAQTNTGKIIYGFFCGFFGIMIRVFNPAYPEGIMLAILFMNVMAPLIDHYVIQANVKRRQKRLKAAAAAAS